MKISEPGYFLPHIHGLNPLQVFDSGATLPLYFRGICDTTHEKDDYVVKCVGAPEMDSKACYKELIAAFIAMELELNIAIPVVVDISQDFANIAANEFPEIAFINQSLGANVGSLKINGSIPFTNRMDLTKEEAFQSYEIFAFDALIANVDRTEVKQNMITNGKVVSIFDHQKAFSFLLALFGGNQTPWLFDAADDYTLKQHYFFPFLSRNPPNFLPFIDKLAFLDNAFWQKADSLTPNAWKSNDVQKIQTHIESIINNKSDFLNSLQAILI